MIKKDTPTNTTEDKTIFIYSKTERLVSALYLVTNLFHDSEPIKWLLRDKGIGLLSGMLPMSVYVRKDNRTKEMRSRISELLSILLVARRSGILSEMNHSLLEADFIALNGLIADEADAYLNFSIADFLNEEESVKVDGLRYDNPLLPDVVRDVNSIRHPIGHNMSDRMSYTKPYDRGISKGVGTTPRVSNSQNKRTAGGEERKKNILKLAKESGSVTVREVTNIIKDCSEKTIQRDLMTLVNDGVLRKVGDRRWSRYTLVI
jgi:hypothetical protein